MKEFVIYLRNYFRQVNLFAFLLVSLLVAVLIIINYTVGIENNIMAVSNWPSRTAGFFFLYTFTFCAAYFFQCIFSSDQIFVNTSFYILLLAAPAIFALKVTFNWFALLITQNMSAPWAQYSYITLAWPLKCLLVLVLVVIIWKKYRYDLPIAGLLGKGFNIKPYLLLLLCIAPLVVLAATRPDFLHTYPKVERIAFMDNYAGHGTLWKILFELSYGSDFFTIELFFRGFLVLSFIRYAGKDAILPMAAFYCTIHFGKPLFECITSFFGGLALGAIVYNTRSIWGGLIVHLGIAWMMEVAGYFGHLWK
jgi:hypothetical protein